MRIVSIVPPKYNEGTTHPINTPKIVNSCQEEQRPTEAVFFNGAESFQLPTQALGCLFA